MVLSHVEFLELCGEKECELNGTVYEQDLIYSNTKNIIEKKFYNEDGDETSIYYRENFFIDGSMYEIFEI